MKNNESPNPSFLMCDTLKMIYTGVSLIPRQRGRRETFLSSMRPGYEAILGLVGTLTGQTLSHHMPQKSLACEGLVGCSLQDYYRHTRSCFSHLLLPLKVILLFRDLATRWWTCMSEGARRMKEMKGYINYVANLLN